jgi:hypothetical protein
MTDEVAHRVRIAKDLYKNLVVIIIQYDGIVGKSLR